MSDEVHQDNVSDSNTPSVEELQAKVASLEKAANDYKGDMFKYKEQSKTASEQLESLQAKMPNDDELKALREFQEAQKQKLEEEAKLSVDKMEKLKKAEMKALAEKLESEKSALAEKVSKQEQVLRDLTVNAQITNAAAEAGAVKPEQLVALLGSQFDVVDDNGKMIVVALDETGEPRRGEEGVLTAKNVVTNFLNDNPHFLKPSHVVSGTGGTGSVTQTQQPTLTANEALQLVRSGKMTKQEANSMLRVGKAIKE